MRFTQLLKILRAHLALILLTLACAVFLGVMVTAFMPPRYVATSSVLINYSDNAANVGAAPPAQLYNTYLATQIDLIASQDVALKVVDRLGLLSSVTARSRYLGKDSSLQDWTRKIRTKLATVLRRDTESRESSDASAEADATRYALADQILRHSTIRPSTDSSVIQVSYAATTAKAAAEAANAIVRAYIDTTLELNVTPARASSAWLDEQVARLTSNLEKARAALTEYQQRAGIVGVGDTDEVETARLNDLNSQLIAAQSQNHPAIQALKSDLARAQAKMNELPAQLGSNHPTYRQSQAEVNRLRANLEAESARLAEGLRKEIGEQRGSMLQMRKKHAELAALKDAVDHAQRALDDTSQKATQTRLSSQATQTNISVVRVAVPPRSPTTPNALFNLSLAFVIGIALGIGFALWREVVCRFVRSADDIRDLLGVPVLGALNGGRRLTGSARLPRDVFARDINPLLSASR